MGKLSAARNGSFPPHCCLGMCPKQVGCSSGRKAQLVLRGGVCAENRHLIHQHVDKLFLTLQRPYWPTHTQTHKHTPTHTHRINLTEII